MLFKAQPPRFQRLPGVFLALAALFAAPLATPACAEPYLVTDLDKTATGSRPQSFVASDGLVYFSAHRGDVGHEVFVSDGTAEGTRLLVDANPGPTSSFNSYNDYQPRPIAVAGGTVFFFAYDRAGLTRLWATRDDGTAGLLRAADANIGENYRARYLLGAVGDRLLFTADDAFSGHEPWVSDGTDEGTRRLVDLRPGIDDSRPEGFALYAGEAYFVADDGDGFALWRTDGTEEGTRRVDAPFEEVCRYDEMASSARGVLVAARTAEAGCEPWVSDGTPGGTYLLRDVIAGATGYGLDATFEDAASGRVFFRVDRQLWITDGTAEGTQLLRASGVQRFPSSFAVAGGTLYFSAERGFGFELWASDGTVAGTREVADLSPGVLSSSPQLFTALGERAVFAATTPELGQELWITDGTAAGTALLADIAAGPQSSVPQARGLDDRLWIRANDGTSGPEPWISDGTTAGTRRVIDLNVDGTEDSYLENLQNAGDQGVFGFFDGTDPLDPQRDRLWVTDGTDGGTAPMENPAGFEIAFPRALTPAGDALYFTAYDPDHGAELLRYEGSGPPAVLELEAGPEGTDPSHLTAVGERLFFTRVLEGDFELWRLNAGASSATFLAVLRPGIDGPGSDGPGLDASSTGEATPKGPYFSPPFQAFHPFGDDRLAAFIVTDLNDDLYADFEDEEWLWVSDGTPAGTQRLARVAFLTGGASEQAALGDRLLFFSRGEGGHYELWRTDGSAGGTAPIARFDQPDSPFPAFLLHHRGHAYFGFVRAGGCRDLWRTDGESIEELDVGCIATAHAAGGQLYITKVAPEGEKELWRLLGEPPRVDRIATWDAGANQPFLVADAPGVAYFLADDEETGRELWRTDGTAEGTRLTGDIAPGPDGSSVTGVVRAEHRLFFVADDLVHGRELWAEPLACVPTPETLCLRDGRFQVRARWADPAGGFGEGLARTRPLTGDSGAFYFFDEANLELAVKVLDGRELTGAFWVFYASLSNVEFELEVLDTETGQVAFYKNEAGTMASVGDTQAIPSPERSTLSTAAPKASAVSAPAVSAPAATKTLCQPAPDVLCLRDGRFRVTAEWQDFEGRTGVGMAGNLSQDTGTFWFFDEQNIELLIKILDGTGYNGHHWTFYASLSNVEFSVTVEDLETGQKKTYRNPSGTFASRADTESF